MVGWLAFTSATTKAQRPADDYRGYVVIDEVGVGSAFTTEVGSRVYTTDNHLDQMRISTWESGVEYPDGRILTMPGNQLIVGVRQDLILMQEIHPETYSYTLRVIQATKTGLQTVADRLVDHYMANSRLLDCDMVLIGDEIEGYATQFGLFDMSLEPISTVVPNDKGYHFSTTACTDSVLYVAVSPVQPDGLVKIGMIDQNGGRVRSFTPIGEPAWRCSKLYATENGPIAYCSQSRPFANKLFKLSSTGEVVAERSLLLPQAHRDLGVYPIAGGSSLAVSGTAELSLLNANLDDVWKIDLAKQIEPAFKQQYPGRYMVRAVTLGPNNTIWCAVGPAGKTGG